MIEPERIFKDIFEKNIAIYGLGTETERFINCYGARLKIVGLLDGFRTEGEVFGYPVITMEQAVEMDITFILVIARPGSCKVIAKRIGDICINHGIKLFDIRGQDLLIKRDVSYEITGISGEDRESLTKKIHDADIVSFDIFDTLITRKVSSYTDIFELMDHELKRQGIYIPNFAALRLELEKELSRNRAPRLEEIYAELLKRIGGNFISAEQLAECEWTIDSETMIVRDAVCAIFYQLVKEGKRVVITTDCYYKREWLERLLEKYNIKGYEKILISCECGTSKTQGLFDILRNATKGTILHIGDDPVADIESAEKRGIATYRLYSGMELFDALGGMGIEDCINSISDRIKVGLFIACIFNDPFCFEKWNNRVSVSDAERIGYLFCAPMITDFVLWMQEKVTKQNYPQVFFCARDGYLIGRLFRKIEDVIRSIYFLTSRTAAIRAGLEAKEDIDYVFGMKFFGSEEQAVMTRFGIDIKETAGQNRDELILKKAEENRNNYRKYIEALSVSSGEIAIFDFVAKGTTQLYLRRLFEQHMKGFYFLQLEPEFMKDKGLDIEPFYIDEERDKSVIFDSYYILETILTSPYPQVVEFDSEGRPKFLKESRSKKDIRCFSDAQKGIENYFDDYIRLVPKEMSKENKRLDERILCLLRKVRIEDEDFLSLTVEDPFFGRMTDIKDVI